MRPFPIPVAAAMLFALAPGAAPAQRESDAVAQFAIRQQVVVRVPRLSPPPTAAMVTAPVEWREKKGPKCISLAGLAGALVTQPGAIDLVQEGGNRVRAQLDRKCRPLDFYSGFYIRPTRDGQVCADRDAVRSRSGRLCQIDKFRQLVAKR